MFETLKKKASEKINEVLKIYRNVNKTPFAFLDIETFLIHTEDYKIEIETSYHRNSVGGISEFNTIYIWNTKTMENREKGYVMFFSGPVSTLRLGQLLAEIYNNI